MQTAMPGLIGEGSGQVNSQLVTRYPFDAIDPLIFGGTYSGPAGYPQQGVFNVPPVMPAPTDAAGQASIQGGPPMATGDSVMAPTQASIEGNVMSVTKGPVVMAVIFIAVALIGLQWIHWHKG